MKKALYIIPLLIGLVVLLASFGDDSNTDYPSGAPAGYTGSPADGQDCHSCHGGTTGATSGVMSSNVPATGYVPGSSYTITVTLTGSTNKGFEVSPQNTGGTLLGSLTAGSNNHITGNKYVTHNAKISSTPAVWTFTWTAPAAGTGAVTFYGAFTLGKPVTKTSTMIIAEDVSVPPVTATATATPSTIAQGSASQLHVTASGGTGTYTYSWTSNPPGFTSTQQNPSVSPTVTTTYTCSVTSGSQNSSANTTVTVLNPVAVTASANPSTVVAGSSSQLSASATGGTGTYTYSWTSNPAGFTSSQQNPTVTPAITTTYTCTVTSGTQNSSANTTVTVLAPLTASASATPASIIEGNSSQLNVTATGGTGSFTYSWSSNPPGFSSTQQNPTVSPVATTVYTCSVTSGTQTTSANATVTVIPVLSASANANPPSITPGGSSQLDAIPSGGTGTYTYLWSSVPAGFTSTQKNPTVTPAVSTDYTVQVTSGAQVTTAMTSVLVSAGLVAVASATPTEINPGETSQLDVSTSGGTGTETYSWTSDPPGFTSTAQNPQVSPTASTTYIVQVTKGTETAIDSVLVTVFGTLAVSASATPSAILAGESSQLTATASGGSGTYTYSWTSDPPGFISNEQTVMVSPLETTVYTVEVTSGSQSGTATATVTVSGITGTGSLTASQIQVYPNPCAGMLNVELNSTGEGMISILDLNGNKVMNEARISDGINRFDLSGLSSGMYLVSIKTNNNVKIFKISKSGK